MKFFVVLFATPTILNACSPLPPGQERTVPLMVNGITLPLEFTYSQTFNVTEEHPMVQKTSNEAVRNLQRYVKGAVTRTIRKIAQDIGYGAFATEIGKQVNTLVYYNPLLCYAMQAEPNIGGPVPQYVPGIGYFCLSKNDAVTKVLYDLNTAADTPQEFQQFNVVLKVSNVVLASWYRNMWEITVARVQSQLRQGVYGTYFRGAEVLLI